MELAGWPCGAERDRLSWIVQRLSDRAQGDPIRGSIRNQILIPLIAVQLGTVATIALVAARAAATRVEGQVAARLEGVVGTLGRSSFPLTGGVLAQMRGLSGAHFATTDESGRLIDSTLPGLSEIPASLRTLPASIRLAEFGSYPKLEFEGERYFAGSVRPGGGPTLLVLYPESAWRQARWEASLPPLGVGALSLAPMAVVTGLVAHRLGTRLKSVQERVAAIAAGDFRAMADDGGGDEVDELVRSVNQMAERLRQMGETIRRTERAGVLAQLAAGLAHQLRNATTGARMAVQLHARRCPGPGLDGSLDVALRQLSICEEQVKGLLSTNREIENQPTRLDTSALVEEVAALVEPSCRHLGVRLDRATEACLSVLADREGLRAALMNLTLNAIEAAGPGGRVELVTSSQACRIWFDVFDNGAGPPPEIAASIFEPFVTGKPEGLGLGLVLVNRVAGALGGSLSWSRVESRTRFRLEIPLAVDGVEESA
jgi:signal transduction histidine kinase